MFTEVCPLCDQKILECFDIEFLGQGFFIDAYRGSGACRLPDSHAYRLNPHC